MIHSTDTFDLRSSEWSDPELNALIDEGGATCYEAYASVAFSKVNLNDDPVLPESTCFSRARPEICTLRG